MAARVFVATSTATMMVAAFVAALIMVTSVTCSDATLPVIDTHNDLIRAAAGCDRVAIEAVLARAPWAASRLSADGSGSALHAVARAPSTDACLDAAAALLRAGADPLAVDAAGHTPVDVARHTDALLQRPDRPPMGLFLAAAASGERAGSMRNHGPLINDNVIPPPHQTVP